MVSSADLRTVSCGGISLTDSSNENAQPPPAAADPDARTEGPLMTDTPAPQDQRGAVHGWTRVSEHAYTRVLAGWNANVGVVVGNQQALLVDSGAGPDQAAQILGWVRELTELPLIAVNSHAHFDHVFGNAYLADPQAGGVEAIWAHEAAAAWIREHGESQRAAVTELDPQFAAGEGPHAAILTPTHTLGSAPKDLDLGGVTATLFHLGRGHTDGDLLVGVDDVVFAGDLVEQGADPAFEGSWPRDWVAALRKLSALRDLYPVVVPGHGEVVGMDFVDSMRTTMEQAVRVATSAVQQSASDATKAVPILPYGPEQARALIRRLRSTR